MEECDIAPNGVRVALATIYEAEVSMGEINTRYGDPVWVNLAVFRDGLPIAALPITGELECDTGEPSMWSF